MLDKRQRSSAKARLTRCINSIKKLMNEDADNLDEIVSLFDDVCKAWNNVEIKHSTYIATLEQDIPDEDVWIEEEQKKFDDVRRDYIKHNENINKKRTLEVAVRSRNTCDVIYIEKYLNLESSSVTGD